MDKETDNSHEILAKMKRREENIAWLEVENSIDRTPPKFTEEPKPRKNIFLSLNAFLP